MSSAEATRFEPFFWSGADDGTTFYSTYSLDSRAVMDDVLPTLMKAVDEVRYDPQGGGPIVIMEYGCRDGGITLEVFRKAIGHIRRKYNPCPDVSIVYHDMPYNDFKSLFLLANGLLGSDPDLAWSRQPRVYFSAVGRDFYEQCLPSNSVHIGVSSFAVNYLSRRPCRIPNAIHHSLIDDAEIRSLHATQAAHDWETFLLRRCEELRPGGLLFIVDFVTSRDSPHHRQTKHGRIIFLTIQTIWKNLYTEARITKEEFETPSYNKYCRTREEFEAPLRHKHSAVYKAGLRLKSLETQTTRCVISEAFESRGIENPKNVAHFARAYADFVRSWGSGDFINALCSRPETERKEIVDELFRRLEEDVKAAPSDFPNDHTHACMVMRKII